MKTILNYLLNKSKQKKTLLCILSVFPFTLVQAQGIDSTEIHRYINAAHSIGVGTSNLLDTYLSPLEYTGTDFRWGYERVHRTKNWQNKWIQQQLYQAQLSITENPSSTAQGFYTMFSGTYALLYEAWKPTKNLLLFVGSRARGQIGGMYNNRNSNNLGQFYATATLQLSALLVYKFIIKETELIARYQCSLPFAGMTFSPRYGESYYEIFGVKKDYNRLYFISLHNAPSMFHSLSLDFPIGKFNLRANYLLDIEQSKINHIKRHAYHHSFMIGFVKNYFLFPKKKAYHSFPLY